ncbi:hypothetical protein KZZ52_41740 [Dactylosporangium sp. AC04546]|uniref:hypothetical protein n=1 Tax=Dactylosporangium sp. AC04546 TaxID=2862460 RepID=UPI001EDF0988|nr:hypothetical protein [Dactylosporangium sp. AC04546]WVK80449.1 hypothetical protein KZZ52_41740 [Dactylosporangium sp. AC04546]
MEAEHHDPWSEGTQRAMERLMALGVLVEAGSRVAAEHARSKANRAEQDLRDRARSELEARQANRLALAERARRAQAWFRFAADGERLRSYLADMPVQEVARHWGEAVRHADHNATAATVLAAAEDELSRRAPSLVDFYRRERDRGVARPEAMANAARYVWFGGGPARSHGGRPATAGALTQIGAELDQEIARLAGTLDAIGRARLLRNLEDAGWSAQSVAHVETLLDRADSQQPASTASSERTETQQASGNPAQVAAQSFPVPAQRALTAHPTATRAAGPSAHAVQRRTR